jgi:hypothetical protein
LAAFTPRCVDRALATAHELLQRFARADAELQT